MFLGHETRRTVLVVRIVDNGSGLVIGVLTKSGVRNLSNLDFWLKSALFWLEK